MKILMVCLGNICRSPLAEGILRHKIQKQGLDWTIDSAGTAAYHIGKGPDPRSVQIAREHGIDISAQRARQFEVQDFADFDRIFAMDSSNYTNITQMAPSEEAREKVELMLNLVRPGYNKNVPDPYYGGADGFEQVYQMLDEACDVLVARE